MRHIILVVLAALAAQMHVAGAETDNNRKSNPSRTLSSDKSAAEMRTELNEQLRAYLLTLMHEPEDGEPWGLFMYCTDPNTPWSIVATDDAWALAKSIGGLEILPGYHAKAKEEMAAFIRKYQDPDTGFFSDPHLDRSFDGRRNGIPDDYKRALTKYAVGLLSMCDSKPLYPCSFSTADKGVFDSKAYLAYVKNGNWQTPWATGSHAGLATVECFRLINEGRDDLIPVLKEGVEMILSHQNPKTGMWGPESISLNEQIGGALKIISRFQPHMGLIAPHMDKLADSIIKHHNSRAFYNPPGEASVPRNVAFMANACLGASDYRKEVLRNVLREVVKEMEVYRQPDGGFSYNMNGRAEKTWCGAVAARRSNDPRSDIHGTIGVGNTVLEILKWLEWTDKERDRYWRDRWDKLRYRIYVDDNGEVHVKLRDTTRE